MPSDHFPNLTDRNFIPRSPPTGEYNCVGWALHDQRNFIWPDERGQFAWPPDMASEDSVASLQRFFERIGFRVCNSLEYEQGFEKIAIYANQDGPQHVARQLPTGSWTSKMGEQLDAEHPTTNVLTGPGMGYVVRTMKRIDTGAPPNLPPLHPPPARLITPQGSPLLR
jgi:hypothetical protein